MAAAEQPHKVTIAVVSDLHASCARDDTPRSHLRLAGAEELETTNPVLGLKALIDKASLTADIVLCPGDLADKAEPIAIRYAWCCVHEIAEKLRATHTIATAGNHDVDSRHQHNSFDAKGILQTLCPPFPIPDEAAFDKYWSRHFAVIEGEIWRIVSLNSSAFHGGSPDECQHGRISSWTLDALKRVLDAGSSRPLNILLCHHHPHQHAEIGLGEKDLMRGGHELLALLGSGRYGEWIVIHGHKHHPKISYASGTTACSPVVFAAGSLSAVLYPELQTRARNQFYLLEFCADEITRHGLVGRFRAWDWAIGDGWVPAGKRSGLPAFGGFGNRTLHRVLAERINDVISDPSTLWSTVCDSIPEARYLLPTDEDLLEEVLQRVYKRKLLRNGEGVIERLEDVE